MIFKNLKISSLQISFFVVFIGLLPTVSQECLGQIKPERAWGSEKDLNVPPAQEWRVCRTDSDCTWAITDCENAGPMMSYNRVFDKEYRALLRKKCEEQLEKIGLSAIVDGAGPAPTCICVQNRCEIAPPKEEKKKSEDHWWSFLKFW